MMDSRSFINLLFLLIAFVPALVLGQTRVDGGPSYRIVYSETATNTTTIWASAPGAHAFRPRQIMAYQHPPGWTGQVSISPDSKMIAYVRITSADTRQARLAELCVYTLSTGETVTIDRAVHPMSQVVWRPDSTGIAYVAAPTDTNNEVGPIVISDIRGNREAVIPLIGQDHKPIGWSAANQFFFYDANESSYTILSQSGVDTRPVYAAQNAGALRDFTFSPDRSSLLFLQANQDWQIVRIDLATGQTDTLARANEELFHPLFTSDGIVVTGAATSKMPGLRINTRRGPRIHAGEVQNAAEISDRAEDAIVLSISPDGRHEALRSYRPMLADTYGTRDNSSGETIWLPLKGSGNDVDFVGWLKQ